VTVVVDGAVACDDFACAERVSGGVVCWGSDFAPQSGGAAEFNTGLAGATRVFARWNTSCALRNDQLLCWGSLPITSTATGPVPTPLP
jgi:hypothetical protein